VLCLGEVWEGEVLHLTVAHGHFQPFFELHNLCMLLSEFVEFLLPPALVIES
jgi:hypothetical protein